MSTQGHTRDVVFLAARRTPFGAFGGSLRNLTATDLATHAAGSALEASGVPASSVEHVYFGNALQTSADALYLARHVALRVGLDESTPAVTVNRLCGSGFEAVAQAAKEILLDDARVCVAGGTESMSQAPHALRGARWGGLRLGDAGGALEDTLWQALHDTYCDMPMAGTAEELARRYGVTRDESDAVALASHRRAYEAREAGRFLGEIAPLRVVGRKGAVDVTDDEHVRADATIGALAGLRPVFSADGLVTAGNASGIGDGAAALVMADAQWAAARGIEPLGRLVSWSFVGVEPRVMGIGPAPASRRALERAGLSLDSMDLVEVNEAFAPQYKAVEKELGLDPERTNVDGGAIALTHPLAASGARLVAHLLHELKRRGGGYGLASACIGGGQGGAMVIEVPAQ